MAQRLKWHELPSLALTVSSIFLAVVLYSLLNRVVGDFNPEAVGLGKNTLSIDTAWYGGSLVAFTHETITYQASIHEDLGHSIASHRAARGSTVLWLGASQLHAINALDRDDRLAVIHANECGYLRGSSIRYFQVAAPNANFNELLALYLTFVNQQAVPDWLLVAVTYDDLKEEGVRPDILQALGSVSEEHLGGGGEGVAHLAEAFRTRERRHDISPSVDNDALLNTPQETLEEVLVSGMETAWPAYAQRDRIRAWLIVKWRLSIIGLVNRLRKTRVVRIPPDVKIWNMKALESLCRLAAANGSRVVLYKQPYKPGEKSLEVNRDAYDLFHEQLATLCIKWGASYVDLETIVPDQLWGVTNQGLPDAFHFTGDGHRILGTAMDSVFERMGQ